MFKETPPRSTATNYDWLSEAEEKAFGLLKTKYEKASISMAKFEKVAGYGPERIKKDLNRVERRKKRNQGTRH